MKKYFFLGHFQIKIRLVIMHVLSMYKTQEYYNLKDN